MPCMLACSHGIKFPSRCFLLRQRECYFSIESYRGTPGIIGLIRARKRPRPGKGWLQVSSLRQSAASLILGRIASWGQVDLFPSRAGSSWLRCHASPLLLPLLLTQFSSSSSYLRDYRVTHNDGVHPPTRHASTQTQHGHGTSSCIDGCTRWKPTFCTAIPSCMGIFTLVFCFVARRQLINSYLKVLHKLKFIYRISDRRINLPDSTVLPVAVLPRPLHKFARNDNTKPLHR